MINTKFNLFLEGFVRKSYNDYGANYHLVKGFYLCKVIHLLLTVMSWKRKYKD